MKSNILLPLIGLIAGILAGMAGASLWVAGVVGIVGCACWFIVRTLAKDPVKAFKVNRWNYLWILFLFTSIGIFSADLKRPYRITGNLKDFVAIEGRVVSVRNGTTGDVAEIDVNRLIDRKGHVSKVGGMKILVRSDIMDCIPDDEIVVTSPLQEIAESPNWFASGYAKHLNNKGFYYQTLCQAEDINIVGHSATFVGVASGVRSNLERFIENTQLSKNTQNFLITVLLGDKTYLRPDRRELFADAGISHVLALSGMHVAIIGGIVMWLLFPINFAGLYRWRMVITVIFLLFYSFLTGLSPSIVRATLMTLAVLVALFMERKNSAWNSLLLATFIILLFSPYSLLDIGMQLSFLCVAAIIFFVSPLNPIDQRSHPILYKVSGFMLTAIVATLGTWCISAWYFGKLPLMFLPANILVLPLLPVFLTCAIIYLALSAIGLEPLWSGKIFDFSLDGLQSALEWLTANGAAAIEFSPSLLSLILWMSLLILLAMLLHGKRTKLLKYSVCIVSLLFIGTVTADAMSEEENDAFIMQTSYRDIRILSREKGYENMLTVPRKTVSHCRLADKNIVILDCDLETLEQDGTDISDLMEECDYLLLASGCKSDLTAIVSRLHPATIVFHPSLRRTRENEMQHIADSLDYRVHSLRLDGPLYVE